MPTISSEAYEAALAKYEALDAGDLCETHRDLISAILDAAGVEVESTPEERLAAFVADFREWRRTAMNPDCPSLRGPVSVVERHFPEVRAGG
jgi:hypothetical protein